MKEQLRLGVSFGLCVMTKANRYCPLTPSLCRLGRYSTEESDQSTSYATSPACLRKSGCRLWNLPWPLARQLQGQQLSQALAPSQCCSWGSGKSERTRSWCFPGAKFYPASWPLSQLQRLDRNSSHRATQAKPRTHETTKVGGYAASPLSISLCFPSWFLRIVE